MKIVGNNFGMNLQDALKVLDRFAEETVAFKIFQVADVLAEKGLAATDDADGVFEFATRREDWLRVVFERDRDRNKTARTAEHLRTSGGQAENGIVAASQDVAIVDEVGIGDALETADGLVVINGNGFFAEIGTGHDESVEFAAGEKEMVEGSVGQEDADEVIARGNAIG